MCPGPVWASTPSAGPSWTITRGWPCGRLNRWRREPGPNQTSSCGRRTLRTSTHCATPTRLTSSTGLWMPSTHRWSWVPCWRSHGPCCPTPASCTSRAGVWQRVMSSDIRSRSPSTSPTARSSAASATRSTWSTPTSPRARASACSGSGLLRLHRG